MRCYFEASEIDCAIDQLKPGLYPKSPPIPSFTIPYISPLIQFTWRSEWKRVSESGHWVHRKDCRFCIVCLRFNNHLKRAAPVVRLKDLSWTLSRKLCINPNSQFTINLYMCCITLWKSASKINQWMIQLLVPSSGETQEFIRRVTLTVHYGDSLAIECTSVVHSFLRCIVGLNECTREHPLWFRTPLKMAVPSNSALYPRRSTTRVHSFYYTQRDAQQYTNMPNITN